VVVCARKDAGKRALLAKVGMDVVSEWHLKSF
jgi:hypothetical protein